MRLICSWRQRQLARHAVMQKPPLPGSPLAQHLAHCSDCTAAYQEMIRLQGDVLQKLPSPTISPDFDAHLMARFATEIRGASPLQPSKAPPMLRPLALGGAIAIAMIIGGQLWRIHLLADRTSINTKSDRMPGLSASSLPHKMAPSSYARITVPRDVLPPIAAEIHSSARGSQSHHRRRHRGGRSTGALYARTDRERIKRHHRRLVSPQPNTLWVLVLTHAKTWRAVARAYEACGDYSRACRAYDRALATQPDADLAIAAGETAERTGDTSRALTYLAQLLSEGSNDETAAPDEPVDNRQERD